jgi:DDE superfamily endonuclease
MEDLLDLYAQPYDPARPVVCVDEKLVMLHTDVHPVTPVMPGHPERVDYKYQRIGTANLFVTVEPLARWRHTEVTDRRTRRDFAHHLTWLADKRYPDAEVIRLVDDNLNIHALSSLYLEYAPEEARRLVQRFEVHHTLKHASWLDMAETADNGAGTGTQRRPRSDSVALPDSRRSSQDASGYPLLAHLYDPPNLEPI